MKRKIHCIEMEENPDKEYNFKELSEMVGWIDYDEKKDVWDVTMVDGSGFECPNQSIAQIMASVEETKAMVMERYLKENGK